MGVVAWPDDVAHMSQAAERIQEAIEMIRRFQATPYEAASLAYLRAQIEQARKARSP
jgi:hypothetical protein